MVRHDPRSVRRASALLLGAAALATIAACSSSGSSPSTPPSSPTTSPGGGQTMTGSPIPATTSSTQAPTHTRSGSAQAGFGGVAACTGSQLRTSIDPRPVKGQTTGAHGDTAAIVDFVNTSSASCSIHGYPGAALLSSSGAQVKQATRTIRGKLLGLPVGQNTLPTVTLKPGAYASAGLEGVNQQEVGAAQAGCDNAYYSHMLVTAPNTSTSVEIKLEWPVCYSFTVHPTNIEKNPPSS